MVRQPGRKLGGLGCQVAGVQGEELRQRGLGIWHAAQPPQPRRAGSPGGEEAQRQAPTAEPKGASAGLLLTRHARQRCRLPSLEGRGAGGRVPNVCQAGHVCCCCLRLCLCQGITWQGV